MAFLGRQHDLIRIFVLFVTAWKGHPTSFETEPRMRVLDLIGTRAPTCVRVEGFDESHFITRLDGFRTNGIRSFAPPMVRCTTKS